jgi:hypothetical protein
MTLQNWQANGWLRQHETSPQEIADLLRIVERDLQDACRVKRNQAEYDRTGVVSFGEAEELIAFVKEFDVCVRNWLQNQS